ncbi:hypothetical protein Micbo1qcDRAFT_166847, partial [Microdochium bolleyi]
MAESAGLALGVISLAIQVCKGIITYVDVVRGKTDALNPLEEKAKDLSRTLELVGKTLDHIRATATDSQSPTTVGLLATIGHSVKSCEHDLEELEKFLDRYADRLPASGRRSGFKVTYNNLKRTLEYGFREKEVGEMETRLGAVNSTLSLGLQSLSLGFAIDQTEKIAALQSNGIQLGTHVLTRYQAVGNMQEESAQILQQLDSLEETMEKLIEPLTRILQMNQSEVLS